MKDKFIEWFGRNRKTIGYTVGALNLLSGISYLISDLIGLAILWLIVGAMIIIDTREFK